MRIGAQSNNKIPHNKIIPHNNSPHRTTATHSIYRTHYSWVYWHSAEIPYSSESTSLLFTSKLAPVSVPLSCVLYNPTITISKQIAILTKQKLFTTFFSIKYTDLISLKDMFGVKNTFSSRDLILPKDSKYSPLAIDLQDSVHYTKFRTLLLSKRVLISSQTYRTCYTCCEREISYFPVGLISRLNVNNFCGQFSLLPLTSSTLSWKCPVISCSQ